MPVLRPHEGGFSSFFGKPSFVESMVTFAQGAAFFQGIPATSDSDGEKGRGTRIVNLSGDVLHSHIVEVPSETTIRTLVEEIGGGVASGRHIKAVAFGGPLGIFSRPTSWICLSIRSLSFRRVLPEDRRRSRSFIPGAAPWS